MFLLFYAFLVPIYVVVSWLFRIFTDVLLLYTVIVPVYSLTACCLLIVAFLFSFFKLSGFYEFFSFQLPYLEKLVFLQIYQFPINNNNNNNNIRNNNQYNNIGFYLNISIPLMVNLYHICVIKTEIIKTIIQKIDKT